MLVSVQDLRRYMGGLETTPGLELEMANILMGTQLSLEAYLNRPVELVQVREVAISDSKGNLYLSVTPVRKVISYGVTVDAITAPETIATPYTITPDALIGDDGRVIDKVWYRWSAANFRPWGFWVTSPLTRYAVEYIGGLDGMNLEHIKLAIKRVAAREYTNYVNTAGLRTGNVEQTEIGDNRNLGWTTGELESLKRYRRRIIL